MQKVRLELLLRIDKLKDLFGCSNMVALEVSGLVLRSINDGIAIEFEDDYSISPVASGC
jgi:hypothetical protein